MAENVMLEVFFLAQFDCPYFLNKNSKIILDVILGQKILSHADDVSRNKSPHNFGLYVHNSALTQESDLLEEIIIMFAQLSPDSRMMKRLSNGMSCPLKTYLHIEAITVFIEALIDDGHKSSVWLNRKELHIAIHQRVKQLWCDRLVRVKCGVRGHIGVKSLNLKNLYTHVGRQQEDCLVSVLGKLRGRVIDVDHLRRGTQGVKIMLRNDYDNAELKVSQEWFMRQ